MLKPTWLVWVAAALAAPAFSQNEVSATLANHLRVSRDFTLKVAELMPDASYDFKLTPAQMTFGEQIVHLSQGLEYFTAPILGQKPNPGKPASIKKADVIAFTRKCFDASIETVSKLTPGQLSKSYASEEGNMTGLELVIGLLNHTTHHRASAEMYLRAKGIAPPEYEF